MGDDLSTPRKATAEQIRLFWENQPYATNRCLDLAKFKECFAEDEEEYFGRQLTYVERFQNDYRDKLGEPKEKIKKWKAQARAGVPDGQKRNFILSYFRIDPVEAQKQFALVKSIAGVEFVSLTENSRMIQAQSTLPDYLTQEAKSDLEFMLMYINKKMHLRTCYFLTNIMQLLLIFLKPAEVYAVVEAMRMGTQETSNAKDMDGLRWHFTLSQQLYNKTLASYVETWLKTTMKKKRSVLTHCNEIGFDFTQYVDSCFRNFLTDYLPLSSLIDCLLIYLVEGIKSIYRFTYAVTKTHKDMINSIPKGSNFIEVLGRHSRRTMPFMHGFFMKYTFKYPLGAARRHRLTQQEVTAMMSRSIRKDKLAEMIDYLPNAPLKSTIIDYNTYAQFWLTVPSYIRIRIPQLVFKASEDGYNIRQLYAAVQPYSNSYYTCLLLIKDRDNNVFGALLDTVPQEQGETYFGGHDSFVFTLVPQMQAYLSTGENDYIMLCANEYMNIGAQGKGPAIHLDATFKACSTNESLTFKNKMLHSREAADIAAASTNGLFVESFEVLDLELFII